MNLTFPGANGAARILAASAVAVSCPADTTEDILATINVPAGAMGLNGILRLFFQGTFTNSAGTKTYRVRLGGIGGTIMFASTAMTTQVGADGYCIITNRGASNSQRSQGALFMGSNAFTYAAGANAAIDTSAAQTVVITGQKNTGGDTLTLESYLVELILP